MKAMLFPFQGELSYFLGAEDKTKAQSQTAGPLSVLIPPRRSNWRLAVCGQGKVEAALAAQIIHASLAPDTFLLLGSAAALDPALRVGDLVLANPCVEWDFGEVGVAGRPTFQNTIAFPDHPMVAQMLRKGTVLSGDRDVFDPGEKAALRERYQAAALAWEGAGFHRFLRKNRVQGWELRLITEEAGEGRPTLALLRERMAAGFPRLRMLMEALF